MFQKDRDRFRIEFMSYVNEQIPSKFYLWNQFLWTLN